MCSDRRRYFCGVPLNKELSCRRPRGPATGFTALCVTAHKGCLMHFLASTFRYDFCQIRGMGRSKILINLYFNARSSNMGCKWDVNTLAQMSWLDLYWGTGKALQYWLCRMSWRAVSLVLTYPPFQHPQSIDLNTAVGCNPQPAFRKVEEVSSLVCRITGRPAMSTMDSGGNRQKQRVQGWSNIAGVLLEVINITETERKKKEKTRGQEKYD